MQEELRIKRSSNKGEIIFAKNIDDSDGVTFLTPDWRTIYAKENEVTEYADDDGGQINESARQATRLLEIILRLPKASISKILNLLDLLEFINAINPETVDLELTFWDENGARYVETYSNCIMVDAVKPDENNTSQYAKFSVMFRCLKPPKIREVYDA